MRWRWPWSLEIVEPVATVNGEPVVVGSPRGPGEIDKLSRQFADDWRAEMMLDSSRANVDTDVVSQRFAAGRFATTWQLLADDMQQRAAHIDVVIARRP